MVDFLKMGWQRKETFWALQDVSFEVYPGDTLGIIGRNGAGKTTLLKILSRITPPTKGHIKVRGRMASLLEVGTGFHPELTGRENIYLNGSILGLKRAEINRQFDAIVDFSGVEQFLDTPLKHYSSGMQLRLAFAVAAHLEPELLLIDEVLAVGDAEFQKKCFDKMNALGKSGKTLLFVSHDLGTMSKLCKQTILLDKGKITMHEQSAIAIQAYLSSNKATSIIELLSQKSKYLHLIKISVNGSCQSQLTIMPGQRNLNFEVTFRLERKLPVSFAAILFEAFGKQIGFYSPGHISPSEQVYFLEPGNHTFHSTIELPNLTKGNYHLSLMLHYPGVECYAFFDKALSIFCTGTPTESGWIFEQPTNGYFLLGGNIINS